MVARVVLVIAASLLLAATVATPALSDGTGGSGTIPTGTQQDPDGDGPHLGDRTLKRGMRGPDVAELQTRLNALHYAVGVSQVFDTRTRHRVKRFQRDYGLPSTGVVGKKTVARLRTVKRADPAGWADWVFPIKPIRKVVPPSYWYPDQGIDIATFDGACGPDAVEVAVTSGTVVQIGISGFGDWSPIIKVDQGAYAGRYIYYGHAKPNLVKKRDHVVTGQPVAQLGCGRVGISGAPHIEIGISAPGGGPCCPSWGQTAPLMKQMMLDLYKKANSGQGQ